MASAASAGDEGGGGEGGGGEGGGAAGGVVALGVVVGSAGGAGTASKEPTTLIRLGLGNLPQPPPPPQP